MANQKNQALLEALLFAADRLEHVSKVIEPALDSDKVVIGDRYVFSSLAYQFASGANIRWVRRINEFAPKPELAIYLDLEVEECVGRSKNKGLALNKFEADIRFRRKARQVFVSLSRRNLVKLIDSSRPPDQVRNEIEEEVLKVLRASELPTRKEAIPDHDVR